MKRVLKRKEASAKSGLSDSSMYAKIASGEFPKPIKIFGRTNGWLEEEIDAWIEARVAERDGRKAKEAA